MIEPPLPLRRIDDGPLMRSVDRSGALFQYHSLFVRAVDILCAQHRLPSCPHATFGNRQVIIAISFEEFGSLSHRTRVYCDPLVEECAAIRAHLMYDDGSRTMLATPEIGLSVVIPERARVFPMPHRLDHVQGTPWTLRVLSLSHEQTLMRCAEIDPELPIMVTDGGCPRATSIALVGVPSRQVESMVNLREDMPVDHVVGLKDLHADEMEVGGHHIVFIADPDDVGVGIVGAKDGVDIRTIALVAPIQDGNVLGCQGRYGHTTTEQQDASQFHVHGDKV